MITDLGPDSDSSQETHYQPANSKSHLGHGIPKTELQIGDQVLGACRFGSYTTCLNVSTQQVRHTVNAKGLQCHMVMNGTVPISPVDTPATFQSLSL